MENLSFIVPEKETFGRLTFAGSEKEVLTGDYRNRKVTGREYHLFSDEQFATDVVVRIPVTAGKKEFKFEEEVELVNPVLIPRAERITGNAQNTGNGSYVEYDLTADDIVLKK